MEVQRAMMAGTRRDSSDCQADRKSTGRRISESRKISSASFFAAVPLNQPTGDSGYRVQKPKYHKVIPVAERPIDVPLELVKSTLSPKKAKGRDRMLGRSPNSAFLQCVPSKQNQGEASFMAGPDKLTWISTLRGFAATNAFQLTVDRGQLVAPLEPDLWSRDTSWVKVVDMSGKTGYIPTDCIVLVKRQALSVEV